MRKHAAQHGGHIVCIMGSCICPLALSEICPNVDGSPNNLTYMPLWLRVIDARTLKEYMCEGWLLAKKGGDITVCPDATRCGSPAEESIQIPCWLDAHSLGVTLPCQVPLQVEGQG